MAHYRVLETCYINDSLCDEGKELYLPSDFPFGPHLEALDDEAKAAQKKFEDAGHITPADPHFIAAMVSHNEDKAGDKPSEPGLRVDRKGSIRGVTES